MCYLLAYLFISLFASLLFLMLLMLLSLFPLTAERVQHELVPGDAPDDGRTRAAPLVGLEDLGLEQ